MNKLYNDFISILNNVILNKKVEVNDCDVDKLMRLASYHNLDCIIYDGLKNLGYDVSSYTNKYQLLMHKGITQDCELESIKDTFSNEKIRNIPLKGSIIKNYYPQIYYRQMADLDILFDEENLERVKDILESLGYNQDMAEGNHDVYYKKPFMNIEAHRNLISIEYSFHEYFNKPFEDTISDATYPYTYLFTDEKYYLFLMAHGAKHFSTGGNGIRFLIDVYLYNINHKNMNFDYLNNQFELIGLKTFEIKIKKLAYDIFGDLDNCDWTLLEFMFEASTYGTSKNYVSQRTEIDESGAKRNKYMFKRLFPSYKEMSYRYKRLQKYPILLPFYYIYRFFNALGNKKKFNNEIKTAKNVSSDDIKKVKEITKSLGLENTYEN